MMGLAYLGAAALFLTVMFLVMRWAWRRGRANGGSVGRASAFAFAGFLVVYLPVFWNWIPVVLTHRHLCNTDAGFTVYVTPEQWVEQNRDRLASLSGVDLEAIRNSTETAKDHYRHEFFGGLLASETLDKDWSQFGVRFSRVEKKVIDVRTNATLLKSVGYSAGNREHIFFWTWQRSCFDSETENPSTLRRQFITKLKEAIK